MTTAPKPFVLVLGGTGFTGRSIVRLFNYRVVKQSLVRTDYILHLFMREKLRAAHDYIARTSVYWTFISTHHHRPHNVSTLFAAEIH